MKPLLNFFVLSFVIIVAIGSVISLAYVSAQVQVGQVVGDIDGVTIIVPKTPVFNNNTESVNFSVFADIWLTSEGEQDNVVDLFPTFIDAGFNSTIDIHDQDLNTTSNNVRFNTTNITTSIAIGNGSDFSHELDVHGHVEIEHDADEDSDHALEIQVDVAGFGDIKALFIDYDSGAIVAEQDEEVIFLNIDQFEALDGAITGLLMVATEGAAEVTGLQVGVEINPIFQLSGIFGNMDSALNNTIDVRTAFITPGDDVDIFVEDDDTVTLGNDVRFEEIEFILNRSAGGAGIKPQFWHSTGVNTWSLFSPADGTSGLRDSGVIIWEISDIPDWEVGLGSEFLIRINRTQNNIPVTPIESLVQIAVAEDFFWNKDADLRVGSVFVVGARNITIRDENIVLSSPSTGLLNMQFNGLGSGVNFMQGGNSIMTFLGVGAIFNDDQAEGPDFQVKTSINPNAFFIDNSLESIGFFTTILSSIFTFNGTANFTDNLNVEGNITNGVCGSSGEFLLNEGGTHTSGQAWLSGATRNQRGQRMACNGIITALGVGWDVDPIVNAEFVHVEVNDADVECSLNITTTIGDNAGLINNTCNVAFVEGDAIKVEGDFGAGGTSLDDGTAVVYVRWTY